MNPSHLTYLASQRHPTRSDNERHRRRLVASEAKPGRRRFSFSQILRGAYCALAPVDARVECLD